MATLKEKYRSEIAPALKEELGLINVMEVPRITKITLNMGVGEAVGDKKVMENALSDMTKIRWAETDCHELKAVDCRF